MLRFYVLSVAAAAGMNGQWWTPLAVAPLFLVYALSKIYRQGA